MKSVDQFRFTMSQALDEVDTIECSLQERLKGLEAMQELLIEAYVAADEQLEKEKTGNVVQMRDWRRKRRAM